MFLFVRRIDALKIAHTGQTISLLSHRFSFSLVYVYTLVEKYLHSQTIYNIYTHRHTHSRIGATFATRLHVIPVCLYGLCICLHGSSEYVHIHDIIFEGDAVFNCQKNAVFRRYMHFFLVYLPIYVFSLH